MKRPFRSAILFVTLSAALASASTVFMMKKEAERDARQIGELNRKISGERQRISELQAEWSALDHPARLQALVDRHNDVLGLSPIAAEQMTSVSEVASAARAKALEDAEAVERAEP